MTKSSTTKLLITYFSATILCKYIDIKQLNDIGLVHENRISFQEIFSRTQYIYLYQRQKSNFTLALDNYLLEKSVVLLLIHFPKDTSIVHTWVHFNLASIPHRKGLFTENCSYQICTQIRCLILLILIFRAYHDQYTLKHKTLEVLLKNNLHGKGILITNGEFLVVKLAH